MKTTKTEIELLSKGNNPMQYEVLSPYAVLAHERKNEYQALLSALIEEHQPIGITEACLVEELATVLWRKRRILQTEGADITQHLEESATRYTEEEIFGSCYSEMAVCTRSSGDLFELVALPREEIIQRQQETKQELETIKKAQAILHQNKSTAYKKALSLLPPGEQERWQEHLDEAECSETAEELMRFINTLFLECIKFHAQAMKYEETKAHILGQALHGYEQEKIIRYETHLDRKFEQILAMLLKMKLLRKPASDNQLEQKAA